MLIGECFWPEYTAFIAKIQILAENDELWRNWLALGFSGIAITTPCQCTSQNPTLMHARLSSPSPLHYGLLWLERVRPGPLGWAVGVFSGWAPGSGWCSPHVHRWGLWSSWRCTPLPERREGDRKYDDCNVSNCPWTQSHNLKALFSPP